jgi:serine/threonine protein phosphatase PrpC
MTTTGMKPGTKEWINQDNYLVNEDSENLKSGRHIYAVFDGHGRTGHEVSTFCRDQLLNILDLSGGCFVPTFEQLHEALKNSSIDINSSGTTCSIVVLKEGTVEVRGMRES